jgi:hypothetical protein
VRRPITADERPKAPPEMSKLLIRLITGSLLLAAVFATTSALSFTTAPASASTGQLSIIQDETFLKSPTTSLPLVRALGARVIRVFVQWSLVAPRPDSTSKPDFDASNPSAYPAANWAPYDALVRTAHEQGIEVDLEITGGGPHWAEGKNLPTVYVENSSFGWRPNPAMYGQFVHAVTERYDGRFTPTGSTDPLPAVHFWSFWNEPNFGQDLGPQAIDGSTRPIAPALYRSLLDAGYAALRRTQPGAHNTVLIGELAATGYPLHAPGHPGNLPGVTAQTRALVFLRALYCVSDRYKPLQGSTAARYGCPATAAGTRAFRSRNPALFDATGFADHPYSSRRAPNANPAKINRDYATFPVLGRVATALDGVTGAYGSRRRLPIYNDEYGYITSPPQPADLRYPTPARAAVELNQAEYLSYKNPRVASYAQFLLDDPPITPAHPKPGFSSGLYTSTGAAKATLDAYRLPLWLPVTTAKAGSRVEIWGGARPAAFATSALGAAAPTVAVQEQNDSQSGWSTIRTVAVSEPTGYFDLRMQLLYTGKLRLAYTYPLNEPFLPDKVAGTTIYSRAVNVTVTG